LVTTPNWVKNKLADTRRAYLDLSELKIVVYDEADELFKTNVTDQTGGNKPAF
jgi:superfamily II DNA/RNA helicase